MKKRTAVEVALAVGLAAGGLSSIPGALAAEPRCWDAGTPPRLTQEVGTTFIGHDGVYRCTDVGDPSDGNWIRISPAVLAATPMPTVTPAPTLTPVPPQVATRATTNPNSEARSQLDLLKALAVASGVFAVGLVSATGALCAASSRGRKGVFEDQASGVTFDLAEELSFTERYSPLRVRVPLQRIVDHFGGPAMGLTSQLRIANGVSLEVQPDDLERVLLNERECPLPKALHDGARILIDGRETVIFKEEADGDEP